MFYNYNHSYKMNALQKCFAVLKIKKLNVYFDEEWVMCDLNVSEPVLSIMPEPVLTVKQEPVLTVKQEPVLSIKQEPNLSIKQEPNLSIKQELISEKRIINLATPVNIFGWFYFIYEGFLDIVEEIFALQVFLLFDEKRMPSSFCV
jgi:hypothetical protein